MNDENDDQNDGEWDERSDLTRIEDLSEFLHEDDPDVDAKLQGAEDLEDDLPDLPDPEDAIGLDQLEVDGTDFIEEDDSFSSNDENEESPPSESKGDGFDTEGPTNPALVVDADELAAGFPEAAPPEESSADDGASFPSHEGQDLQGDSFEGSSNFEASEEDSDFESSDSDFDGDYGESEDFGGDEEWQSRASSDEDDSEESADWGSNWSEDTTSEEDDDSQEENEDNQSFLAETESFDQEEDTAEPEDKSSAPLPEPDELDAPPISALSQDEDHSSLAPRENFQDLRDFGNAITYGIVKTGGNPPFSIILRQVKYEEDAEDIKIILREHGLLTEENEETINQGLEQGSLLISQISEYSAIFLAHKLRRFDVEIRLGLSDQLHPSKSYGREGKGLVSKYNLEQNRREVMEGDHQGVNIEDIKLTTTPTLESYNIIRYIDVLTAHTLVDELELRRLHRLGQTDMENDEDDEIEVYLSEGLQDSDEDSRFILENYDLGLNEIYKDLAEQLRNSAYKIEANAVVGINYTITPLVFRGEASGEIHYKITCSGSAVWVVDQKVL